MSELFLTNPRAHRIIGRRAMHRRQSLLLDISSVAKSVGIGQELLQEFEKGKGHLSDEQFNRLQDTLRISTHEICHGILSAA